MKSYLKAVPSSLKCRPDVDRVYGDHFLPARHFVLHPLRLWFGVGDIGVDDFGARF